MNDWSRELNVGEQAGAVRPDERALAVIWPLLGRHIAFHRRLVDLTANSHPAPALGARFHAGHRTLR